MYTKLVALAVIAASAAATEVGRSLRSINVHGRGRHGLGLCQGDCDSNAQCARGLVCQQRNGYSRIRGCRGRGRRDWDYCVRSAHWYRVQAHRRRMAHLRRVRAARRRAHIRRMNAIRAARRRAAAHRRRLAIARARRAAHLRRVRAARARRARILAHRRRVAAARRRAHLRRVAAARRRAA